MHQALYSGARKAARLALAWEREGYPDEAKRARERAAYYLRSRRWILNDLEKQQKEETHVRAEA